MTISSRRVLFSAAAAVLCCLTARPARAESDVAVEDVFSLVTGEVATAASRHPQPVRDSPSAVTVITADDIRASGYTSIPQLLRSVAGLNVVQASASEWAVNAHERSNFPGGGVLTMIDGRAASLDFFNIVLWEALPVTIDEIDRIEVVKSPSSSLWGANAMNGIINIVTKSPEQAKGLRVSYAGGDFQKHQAYALLGGTSGDWGYRASGGYDTQHHFPNPLRNRSRELLADKSSKGNVELRHKQGAQGNLTLRAGVDDSLGEVQTALGVFDRDGQTSFLQAGYEWHAWKFQFYYNGLNLDIKTTGLPTSIVKGDAYDAEFQNTVSVPWNQLFTWGMDGRFNTAHSPAVIGQDEDETRWGLFLQDEYTPWDVLKFTLGARFDSFSAASDFVSERFGAVWTPGPAHTWRVSAGRSFNKPDTVNLFSDLVTTRSLREFNPALPASPFTITLEGDPGLETERVDAVEFGYQNTSFRRVTGRVDAFLKKQVGDVSPRIVAYYPANSFFPGSPGNAIPKTIREVALGDGYVWGGETGVDFLLGRRLKCFANYSLQRESGLLLGQSGPGNKVNAGSRWSGADGWSLYGVMHYVDVRHFESRSRPFPTLGPATVPAYTTADARVAYRFNPHVEVAVAGVNLFNDKHREFVDTDVLERQVLGQLTVEW